MKKYAIVLLVGYRACFVLCIVSQICGCTSDRQKLVPFSEIWISGGAISELNAQLDRAVFAAGAHIFYAVAVWVAPTGLARRISRACTSGCVAPFYAVHSYIFPALI